MALNKQCELGSKVIIGYFVIDVIHFYPQSATASAEIRGFLSEQAMNDGASPAWEGRISWETGSAPQLAAAATEYGYSKLAIAIDEGRVR